jgi:hypothetical protein
MSLTDFITVMRLVGAFLGSARPLASALRSPLLTVVLITALVLAVAAKREGGLQAGFDLLLTDPHAIDTLQHDLSETARRDKLTDDLLRRILAEAPTAARVRLAIIHNGTVGLNGVGLLRYDVTHAIARPGFSPGRLSSNGTLSDWIPFLNEMLASRCTYETLATAEQKTHDKMLEFGESSRMSCPVIDFQDHLLGGMFVSWQDGTTPAAPAELTRLEAYTKAAGLQIAAAMIATTPTPN